MTSRCMIWFCKHPHNIILNGGSSSYKKIAARTHLQLCIVLLLSYSDTLTMNTQLLHLDDLIAVAGVVSMFSSHALTLSIASFAFLFLTKGTARMYVSIATKSRCRPTWTPWARPPRRRPGSCWRRSLLPRRRRSPTPERRMRPATEPARRHLRWAIMLETTTPTASGRCLRMGRRRRRGRTASRPPRRRSCRAGRRGCLCGRDLRHQW